MALRGALAAAIAWIPNLAAAVDYATEIRPIFERHCYECHGPDSRKGDLRLSNRKDAFAPALSGIPVIEPFDSSFSILVHMITSDDPEERMPKEREPLAAVEVDLVRRWIDEGAAWPEKEPGDGGHWAYREPERPPLPEVAASDWPRNGIDRFVLARLEQAGLTPSPPAGDDTLLRRLHLDLTGLPPTLEQQEQFREDTAAGRVERTVERLLASRAFGERWATGWLDLARYADSDGFQPDRLRDAAWPYRDWVIRAINQDLPFDRFVIEQIAGDMLEEASLSARIASGFNRQAASNLEAGIHAEQSRVEQVVDRVNTVGTAFLGTTLKCAQCHDHKYDPISTREYYSLFAFFNNSAAAAEPAKAGALIYLLGGPMVEIPLSPSQQERREVLERQLREQKKHMWPTRRQIDRWIAAKSQWSADPEAWRAVDVREVSGSAGETFAVLDDGSVLVSGPVPDSSTYVVDFASPLETITAVKLEALPHESIPGGGPGRGDAEQPIAVISEAGLEVLAPRTAAQRIYRPAQILSSISDLPGAKAAFDGDLLSGWRIQSGFGAPHFISFALLQPIETAGSRLRLLVNQADGSFHTLGRFRVLVSDRDPGEIMIPPRIRRLLKMKKRNRKQERKLRAFVRRQLADPAALRRVRSYENELAALEPARAMVMRELPDGRQSHVLIRGDHLQKGEPVSPATPQFLHPFPSQLAKDRLGLARWLASPENPLLARVAVNRWWAQIFGRGLVATPEDFGIRGARPSHPQLLDWLATELVRSGWSRKQVVRAIVTSATYRQSAALGRREARQIDPENHLLWHSPRPRLPAEVLRDQALSVSGLLSREMGGPPVYPPQPPGVWNLIGPLQPRYRQSPAPDKFRRSVYVIRRRSSPYPNLRLFDSPDRAECTARRERTNTPMQALTLLNDPAYVEMSLGLARRIVAEGPQTPVEDKIDLAFRTVLARRPEPRERDLVTRLLAAERARLETDEAAVDAALRDAGDRLVPASAGAESLAAWRSVASSLLALDETLTRP